MKGVDHVIDGGHAVFFNGMCEMGVACGRGGACMAEDGLNVTEAQTAFKQMCGKTVTKGVDVDFFLMPHCATTTFMAF
jgi:hypothetical protein